MTAGYEVLVRLDQLVDLVEVFRRGHFVHQLVDLCGVLVVLLDVDVEERHASLDLYSLDLC